MGLAAGEDLLKLASSLVGAGPKAVVEVVEGLLYHGSGNASDRLPNPLF